MTKIKLPADGLPFLREMDSRLISYNIEMTEVTGGTFWKLYTPAQIEGKESPGVCLYPGQRFLGYHHLLRS